MYLFLVGQLHRWSAGGSASSLGKPERPFQMRLFLPAGPIAIIIKIILGPFQSSSQFFLFFWTGMETCSSHLVRKRVQKKEGEKYGIFAIPEEVWIKSKGIVFSFLYFGSLFRVRFSLFQLGILNLHAIGSKPGNLLFYEHFVLWPVLAARVSPVSHFNRDSASWHLKTWFRNQNCWILYFTIKYISQWHFNCLVGKIDQHKIWV